VCACDHVAAADTTDITDDADSDIDMPDDLLDASDDEDRKRDSFATATADEKVLLLTTTNHAADRRTCYY